MDDYGRFFFSATGAEPFPYQRRLAEAATWPSRIEVPTGLGKTLAVVVAWLWRRRVGGPLRASTPRRLVYCLPMRVLVEQTRDVLVEVIRRLGVATRVVVLMGGVEQPEEAATQSWDIAPEEDAIILGTQDMLLSRALNRGYGMSRFRWPLHFGLLNTDCQWVVDEVQLMGNGVATIAQLQALRRKLGTVLPTGTCWMSATLEEAWLRTVDVEDEDLQGHLCLDTTDLGHEVVKVRVGARKPLRRAASRMGDTKALAAEVAEAHRPGTRTLVVLNTVDRAREVFASLSKTKTTATRVLVHSRFRPPDRARALGAALAEPGPEGTIVISTQVVEAGVDVSSTTLFTEVAPWASLVQRFGRCNRRGLDADARVHFCALPEDPKQRAKLERPYELQQLLVAEEILRDLDDVGPSRLPKKALDLERGLVLRRRDLLDLFDTTPDLMGNDVDVSRFIRDADDHDVRVYWRDIEQEPVADEPSPSRDELCPAPLGVLRDWLKAKQRPMWARDGLRGRWAPLDRIHPGTTVLLRASDGGYEPTRGFDPRASGRVDPVALTEAVEQTLAHEDRDYDGDPESEWRQWYSLSAHSLDVSREAAALAASLGLPAHLESALVAAARWHDAGKAHDVWQNAAKALGSDPPQTLVAKSQAIGKRIRYARPGFRHELASALLALQHGQTDLVAFLIASHHGKVRLSLRSLPNERAPLDEHGSEDRSIRHARGVWEGDVLPEVDLGEGLVVPSSRITLRYMELGHDERTGPSWVSRVLALRDNPELGPFRLGFLEALIKCADERASLKASAERFR